MKTHCPACGAEMSLDIIINNEAARHAVASILAMDKHLGQVVINYLSLFRPAKRSLSFDRVASLLQELMPMIAEGKVTRAGNHYATPRELWKQAIEAVISNRDNLKLPLKGHGYLLEVIVSMVEKHESRMEALKEKQKQGQAGLGNHRHQTHQTSNLPKPTEAVQQEKSEMPAHIRDELKVLKKKMIAQQT